MAKFQPKTFRKPLPTATPSPVFRFDISNRVQPQSGTPEKNERLQLFSFLNETRLQRLMTDFELIFDNHRCPCHRLVLAGRCESLRNALSEDTAKVSYTVISDADALVAEQLLSYVYTFQVKMNEKNVEKLIDLANELGMNDLRETCEEFCKRMPFTKDNVMRFIRLAIRKKLDSLKEHLRSVTSLHFLSLIQGDAVLEAEWDEVALFLEHENLPISNEKVILRLLERWAAVSEQRWEDVGRLMELVKLRWVEMSYQESERWKAAKLFSSSQAKRLFHRAFEYRHFPASRWALEGATMRPRSMYGFHEVLFLISISKDNQIVAQLGRKSAGKTLCTPLYIHLTNVTCLKNSVHLGWAALPLLFGDRIVICCADGATVITDLQGHCETASGFMSRRSNATLVAARDHVYLIGGQYEGRLPLSDQSLSMATKQWDSIPTAPQSVLDPCAFSVDDKIYVFSSTSRSVQVFDVDDGKWTLHADVLDEPVVGLNAVCYDSVIYVLVKGRLATLDLTTWRLTEMARVDDPCDRGLMVIFDHHILLSVQSRILSFDLRVKALSQNMDAPLNWCPPSRQWLSFFLPINDLYALTSFNTASTVNVDGRSQPAPAAPLKAELAS